MAGPAAHPRVGPSQALIATGPGDVRNITRGVAPTDPTPPPDEGGRGEQTAQFGRPRGGRIKNKLEQKKDRLQQACAMLNAQVLSYRDLEAFLARGEETGPPTLFQRTFSAEELAEHWQAIWQAKKPGSRHELHHQDDEDGDPPTGHDTIREAALAITLTSYGSPDDVITPQAHHDEPPTRNFTCVRRTVYGIVFAIVAWWTSRAQIHTHLGSSIPMTS